jgi:hypothetical protein
MNINKGNIDTQEGGANIKNGSINFKFAIGLALIAIGLGSAIYSSKTIQGCNDPIIEAKFEFKVDSSKVTNIKPTQSKKTLARSVQSLTSQKLQNDDSQTQNNHDDLNTIKTDKIYVSTAKGNPIRITGLRIEEQNVLKIKGFYRFHTSGNIYPTMVGINIYSDDNLIKSLDIDTDINKDIKFEQTIFIQDNQSNVINLQLQMQGVGLFDANDYLEFKNGIKITLIK